MKPIERVLVLLALSSLTVATVGAERGERTRPATFRGELAKIEGSSLTVTLRKDSGQTTKSFDIDEKTIIQRETDGVETYGTGEGERPLIRPKRERISLGDLKAGEQVTLSFHEGQPARDVLVLRPKKKKESSPKREREGETGKEGEPQKEKREASRKPREDGRDERKETSIQKRRPSASVDAPSTVATGLKLPSTGLIKSKDSGRWSSPDTWDGGKVPAAGNQVLIREGDQVVYDGVSEEVIRSLHISGTLSFAPDKDTLLNVGLIRVEPGDKVIEEGFDCDHAPDVKQLAARVTDASQPGFSAICVCCRSKSALLVGTPERPIDANRQAVIRLHYIEGMNAQSCPAIVACGGRMDFHGAPLSRTWVKLGASVRDAKRRSNDNEASTITLAEPVTGWRVGDRIIVTSSATNNANDHQPGSYRRGAADRGHMQYRAQTEERVIRRIEGASIDLDRPLTYAHRGESDYAVEVANLSRNLVVESADPNGVRGHTMYHAGSAGSIGFAEFRHLGKEGVLGRYAIHFHLVRDSMRGSSVVGASIWDSHNRWITIHGTQYLVVRDCVGYQSVGHGYFLEDGTEVYNVLDRNLAVQAFRSLPLPKQVLPFDSNDGAGFWWANSLNSFTGNVAVECDEYGFRYEATPRGGVSLEGKRFGSPDEHFDLTQQVRQPDGHSTPVDIRTLPFVRFDGNEAHSLHNYGFNMGEGVKGVGPARENPFVVRNYKAWLVRLAYRPNAPHVLLDGAQLVSNTYGIYQPEYIGHDYRDVVWAGLEGRGVRRRRMPGDKVVGDGGGKAYEPEIEVGKLNPVDKFPPITVITSARREGSQLVVRGTTTDNGETKIVTVNGREARALSPNFSQWEVTIPASGKSIELIAKAIDVKGNVEQTPHAMTLAVAE